MPNFNKLPPLSLYIHLPWCIQKCPYCDFNSHAVKGNLPEAAYVAALLDECDHHLPQCGDRPLVSIFFGGGTPSLFSGQAIGQILDGMATRFDFAADIEITLEANPGTVDQARFHDFRTAGVNRLSLGIQSLQDDKLKRLGRIHDRAHALKAITLAQAAGFDNFNVDLMYGLPDQSLEDALADLDDALQLQPPHLSWYQLTIEPNTVFYRHTPTLPADDLIWDMQVAGMERLRHAGLAQYEVSAYARDGRQCKHNRNYWAFGDYLGLGAGAHSKLTHPTHIVRYAQRKQPRDYLDASKRRDLKPNMISDEDAIFEFMLNALRLTDGVPIDLFSERTGVALEKISDTLQLAKQKGLLTAETTHLRPTALGKKFLNNLVSLFL